MSVWFDAPAWVHDRLSTDLPDLLITPEMEAKINRYPALLWALVVANPDLGIWTGNLTLSLLCSVDDAERLTAEVNNAVSAWPINSVALQTYTPVPSSEVSEAIKQFTFIYSLTWDL